MGAESAVKVRGTYSEPTNIFTIFLAESGLGKTQAFRLSILDPLSELGPPFSQVLVDDYTRQGLFTHLMNQKQRALLACEEIQSFFDVIPKRQLELSGE